MNWNEFLLIYVCGGFIMTALIMLFPQEYLESMGKALIIIKTFSLKRQHRENNTSPPPIKPEQEKYQKELEEGAHQEMLNTQKSPLRFNLNLMKLLVGWPLILFLYFLAGMIKICNLDDPDLP
jgi:hypothetical protein